jgi:hypothetical protein
VSLDIGISVVLGVLTIGMAYLGVHVTLHPVGEARRTQQLYKAGFAVLAVCALSLVWWQGARSEASKRRSDFEQRRAEARITGLQGTLQISIDKQTTALAEAGRIQALNTQLQQELLRQAHQNAQLSREAIQTTTGGDSFCYIVLLNGTIDRSGALPVVVEVGRYPLRDVSADVVDVEAWTQRITAEKSLQSALSVEAKLNIGDMGPSSTKLMIDNRIPFRQGDSQIFLIRFSAQNGFWDQQLRVRFSEGKWHQAARVVRTDKHGHERVVLLQVDPQYPKSEIDWKH